MALKRKRGWLVAAAVVAAVAAGSTTGGRYLSAETRSIGRDHLVRWTPLPEQMGQMCPVPEQGAFQRQGGGAPAPSVEGAKFAKPDRVIRDRYPSFSSIAIDYARDQVVVTDENLFQILYYSRTENNGPNQVATPQRIIGTPWDDGLMNREESKTKIEFQCGLYIDPRNGDVYAVNNDTQDTLVIFSNEQVGNVSPSREVRTPHGTFGLTVDEERQEMFLTVQHDSAIVVYKKGARDEERPVRLLQGDKTRLADPHGVALDPKSGLIFVTNHGSTHQTRIEAGNWLDPKEREERLGFVNFPLDRDFAVPGSGRMLPPAITVYDKMASGDTAPVRVIEGPRTGLNWPTGIAYEPERNELYVTNDTTDSILIFDANASGNVAPRRVLKGPKTGLKNPTGLAIDKQRGELWVANFGGHTATAYRLNAQGDTAPIRTIRAAREGIPSLMIGNPGAVAYDTNREEILTPN